MQTSLCWTFATALLFMASAKAQTTANNAVASFLSEAYSVYTEVTSILASNVQNTATATSSSSSSFSTTTSSSTSSTSSITSTSASPSSSLTSSATLAGAASTSAAAATSGNRGGHNTLAIVLGTVLGALALGLLLLVLVLICCHRRRKARSPRVLSPADEEVESWRGTSGHGMQESGLLGSHATAGRDHSMAAAVAIPDMAEHPAFRTSHENPFVPVPPPPRRTAPNSKVGLTDGTVPGQEPFLSSNGHRLGGSNGSGGSLSTLGRKHDHHAGETLAAGAGGAALGAAAMHHHNKDHDSDPLSQNRYSTNRHSLSRKPVPNGAHTGDGADAALLNESSNPTALSPLNSAGHHHSHSQEALLASGTAVGAGALGGAAIADHHHQHGHRTDSGVFGDNDGNTPVRRAGTPLVPPLMMATHHHQTTLPPDYDMVPNIDNERRHSRPYSGVVPAAALGAYQGNRESSPNNNTPTNRYPRNSTPPAVPSRSPRRTRFSDVPYDPTNQPPTPPLGAASSIDREGNNSSNSSGDSGIRLSSSIPGGWHRDSAESDHHLRNSGINQHGRRSNGSFTDTRDFASGGSGMSGMGSRPISGAGAGAVRPGPTVNPGMGPGPRRHSQSPGDITSERVRLSDLRAEEEQMERERQRGRRYGGTRREWTGEDGYDGYERPAYGVGQAL